MTMDVSIGPGKGRGRVMKVSRAVLLVFVSLLLIAACRSTMSLEEAKKVTAEFAGNAFVPPPRSIHDITAILDEQKLDNPEAAAHARARADQPPPKAADPATLAEFYYQRGLAAREIGRTRQEMEDVAQAAHLSRRPEILSELGRAYLVGGNLSRALEHFRQAIQQIPHHGGGRFLTLNALLAGNFALAGDFEAADAAMQECLTNLGSNRPARYVTAQGTIAAQGMVDMAQAAVFGAKGRLAEAETFWRRSIAAYAGDPVLSKEPVLDVLRSELVFVLVHQGRLLEAESEARGLLLDALRRQGRNTTRTARAVRTLTRVVLEQSRYAEAEALARAAIDIYRKTGSSSDSYLLALAREELAAALVAQNRWAEALAEYAAIRVGLADSPEAYQRSFAGNLTRALALLHTGQTARAVEVLNVALERRRWLAGEQHPGTAEIRGLLATAHVATGDRPIALREFAGAVPLLLTRSLDVDDESVSRVARDQRLNLILTTYIGLLADIRGTPLEREAGLDAAAEAFRLAEVVRGRSVQRALDASTARVAAKTPALAELIRKEQDAGKQVSALAGLLANILSAPVVEQDARVVADLQGRINLLRRARAALVRQIEREFPAYAQLVNPAPATLQQARASLRAGEALISIVVLRNRSFVWAIPHRGAPAFAAVPLNASAIQATVEKLRKALEPNVRLVGDIPAFDVEAAHELYRLLLEPVKSGWEGADILMVVAHAALAQVPFGLLPTKPVRLEPDRAPLFSQYRAVPWLARRYAVTTLPSVHALTTLRAVAAASSARRPFVGFGDPYFSEAQAQEAETYVAAVSARVAARANIEARSLSTQFRDVVVSPDAKVHTSQLHMLPRLPDTRDEIIGMATALKADVDKDVFLGRAANEHTVKSLDLTRYRVIAFATHGLVPGDLDGLTQPALALTAPSVAKVEGDGLLTMEEILGLRLNADWVVLSACNTANGNGAGAEAVSGLGRAFFYAGARALLVTHWPVETRAARALTTELFRRAGSDPSLTRAKALQQTINWMINEGGITDSATGKQVFSFAHPIFWAPFALIGDGG